MSFPELNLLVFGLLLNRSLRIVHDLRACFANEGTLHSLTKSLGHSMQTILATIARLESIVPLCDSVVINLNVCLRCINH